MIPPRGYVFIGLNIIRVLSIVSLLLMLASSLYTMVHDVKAVNQLMVDERHGLNTTIVQETNDYIAGSTVPHQTAGAFWAVVNRLFIIFQVIVLICSEFGWPSAFFDKFFPVLGRDFGLGALGIFQCLLGAAVLSHHSDTFALVAAWFVFGIGCVNALFIGLIFRGTARERRSIFAWRERARDILPTANVAGHKIDVVDAAERFGGFVASQMEKRQHSRNESVQSLRRDHTGASDRSNFSGLGFGRQGEKAAAQRGYMINRPVEALPPYGSSPALFGRTKA